MMGRNLFFLVVEVTGKRVEHWYFEPNQTEAKARVESIKAAPARYVSQPLPDLDFVEVWFPKDKKGMKIALEALADRRLDDFISETRKPKA